METLIRDLISAMELKGSRSAICSYVAYMKVSAAAALKTRRMLAGWYLNVIRIGHAGWYISAFTVRC